MVVTGFEASMNAVVATSFVEKAASFKLLVSGYDWSRQTLHKRRQHALNL
jgi:hypothetical protein